MGLISSLINAITTGVTSKQNADAQVEAAQIASESAKYQADLAYKANQEQIAASKEEAELAFQRNSSSGQLAQLVAAGLSEQQARQVISGSSPGQYVPPEVRSTMEGVDYGAPGQAMAQGMSNAANIKAEGIQQSVGHVAGAIGEVESMFVNSLGQKNGGVIGAMESNAFQELVCSNITSLPTSARGSYGGFKKYLNSSSGAHLNTPEMQAAIKKVDGNPFARRAVNEFFNNSDEFLTGEEKTLSMINGLSRENADLTLKSFEVDAASVQNELAILQAQYGIKLAPKQYELTLNQIKLDLSKLTLDQQAWNSPAYRTETLRYMMSNAKKQAIIAQILEQRAKEQQKWLNQDENANFVAVADLFNEVGLTDSEIGTVITWCEAEGIPVIDKLREFAEALGLADDDVDYDNSPDWDFENAPEILSQEDFDAWRSRTRLKRAFGAGDNFNYIPFTDDDGTTKYRKTEVSSWWFRRL